MMSEPLDLRTNILRSLEVHPAEIQELLAYNANHFETNPAVGPFPLSDEDHIKTWASYANEVEAAGTITVLSKYLPQFRFPIQPGISNTQEYTDATRRGVVNGSNCACKLEFRRPADVSVLIHPTPAGRVPLLITADRADFETLVRALSRRNEPTLVPASMGACVVAGYNNWHRMSLLRERFDATGSAPAEWPLEFAKIKQQKGLYQDSFIILSRGNYSGVAATCLGLDTEQWQETSLILRREHECAHYFTRRVFRSMRNTILDELIADYAGITAATGNYISSWALQFLGLDAFPRYREGGRLQNYRGDPPLSHCAFQTLQHLVLRAVLNLERFDHSHVSAGRGGSVFVALMFTLAGLTVEELASPGAPQVLASRFKNYSQQSIDASAVADVNR